MVATACGLAVLTILAGASAGGRAATCDSWVEQAACERSVDGSCKCAWTQGNCTKPTECSDDTAVGIRIAGAVADSIVEEVPPATKKEVSVKAILTDLDGMLRELSEKVERSYQRSVADEGEFETECPEPLHKCGFDPETETPAEALFEPQGLEMSPVFNQTVSFEAATVYATRTAERDSSGMKALRCTAELLTSDYVRFWRRHGAPTQRYVQQYFGDQTTGALVQHPARPWLPDGPDGGSRYKERCAGEGDYDVRSRSWYTQRVTGPKDIVLVLDTSGSMRQHDRGSLAIKAAERVLGTLSESDLVTVITFSDHAEIFNDEITLHQATRARREEMGVWLESAVLAGETNFEAGLDVAFQALRASTGKERSHSMETHTGLRIRSTQNCERLIFFLTDGEVTVGKQPEELLPFLNRENEGIGAKLLTYSFGAQAAQQTCRDMACAMNGIWWHVADGGDVSDAMSSYYKLLAVSKSEAPEDRPVGFQYYPYDLAGGWDLGACAAVFDRTSSPNMLFGLSCMSANMLEDIQRTRAAPDFNASIVEAGEKSLRCLTPALSEADLQRLRRLISSDTAVCGAKWPSLSEQQAFLAKQTSGTREEGKSTSNAEHRTSWPTCSFFFVFSILFGAVSFFRSDVE